MNFIMVILLFVFAVSVFTIIKNVIKHGGFSKWNEFHKEQRWQALKNSEKQNPVTKKPERQHLRPSAKIEAKQHTERPTTKINAIPKNGLNYKIYKVKGAYTATKRKRSVYIECHANLSVEALAGLEGLVPPFEIEQIEHPEPTDRQLAYARDLGIKIPDNASLQDVSCLISRAVDYDSEPNAGLIEFANGRHMLFSDYIGKKSLYNLVYNSLELQDKIAFFCFSVYRYLSDNRHANLDTSPNKHIFVNFAEQKMNDAKFTKSLAGYEGKELRFFGSMIIVEDNGKESEISGGSARTSSYKDCAAFLHQHFGTPLTKKKRMKISEL